MFTIPTGHPFAAGTSTIPSTGLNYLYSNLPNAWDAVGGGTYTQAAKSTLQGALGLRYDFSAVGVEIGGLGGAHILNGSHITFDDVAELRGIVTNEARIAYRTGVVPDAPTTIYVTSDVYRCTIPTGAHTHTLARLVTSPPQPRDGETITVVRPDTGAFAITFQQEGIAGNLCVFSGSVAASATFVYFDAVNGGNGAWWLMNYTVGVAPGAAATTA